MRFFLCWPADLYLGRDHQNANVAFGDSSYNGANAQPLAWETFGSKIEIYPGNGGSPSYGMTPQYLYDPDSTGNPDGSVSACGQPDTITPWVNLDEKNEIGEATMFAGIAGNTEFPYQQFLYLAKANMAEYSYVSERPGWSAGTAQSFEDAKTKTKNYIQEYNSYPTPSSGSTYVSFQYNTIEMKSAWRRLTQEEMESGRWHTTPVRYYMNQHNGEPCYVDEVWGMAALHINRKTQKAPYFIFATFGQADNILNEEGANVENTAPAD